MDKIENILTNCIKEIKSGKATLAECLERYPSRRKELEPLLKIALNIQGPPALQLDNSYKQTAKARLLQQIRAPREKKSRSFSDIFSFGIPSQFAWARVAVSVLVVVVLLSTLTTGTAFAAQSSLPGDLLYPVKTTTEDARVLFAGSSAAKAELNLEFAQSRLNEMSKLAGSNEENVELAVNGYRGNLEAARKQIQRVSDASSLFSLLEIALDDIQNQTAFCDNIIDNNPKYGEQVKQASILSISEQVTLLQMLALQNNMRATQSNLNAMQSRLQRAQEKANGNQYQLMQEALLQYQQFNQLGEEILQSYNQQNTQVETLTLQTLAGYLNTLDSIFKQVPQEYQNSIETCRQITIEFQNQARYRYQHQGDSGKGSQSQAPENNNGSTMGQNGQSTTPYQGGTNNPDNGTPNTSTTITPSQGTGNGSGSGSGTGSGGDAGGSGGTGAGGTDSSGGSGGGSTSTGGSNGSTDDQKP